MIQRLPSATTATLVALLAGACAQVESAGDVRDPRRPFQAADLGLPPPSADPGASEPPPKPQPDEASPEVVSPQGPTEVPTMDAGFSPPIAEVAGALPPPLPEDDPPSGPGPADGPCEGLDFYGECRGTVVRYCDNGLLVEFNCGWILMSCGWVDDETGYYCGGQGEGPLNAPERPPEEPPAGPSPPEPIDPGSCGSATETRVVDLVNASRARQGLSALSCDNAGIAAARAHSEDQCSMGRMSHTGSDGSDAGQRLRRAGANFGGWGENVAWGADTPEAVHDMWMNSRGHYRNIMGNFSRIGVGHSPCGGRDYWTEVFLN